MSALARSLSGGEAPVYLLHGDAALLTREAAEWLRETVLEGAVVDFNLDRFDGGDRLDPELIVQAARTLPMMARRRLVLVRNADAVFAARKELVGPLVAYAKAPDPLACLLFRANGRVKKTSALYKAIAKHGCVLESKAPRERELAGWVEQRVRARHRQLERGAAGLLVEAIGRDLTALDAAVERLCLYVGVDAPVTLAAVEETVPHTRARTVWELVDAVADRDGAKALARAHQLLGQGEAPLGLLALVTRQFRQLLIGHGARAAGASLEDAASRAGVPSFRVSSFGRQVGRYRSAELVAALDRLARADQTLKGSKLPADLVFESVLMDLCAG